MPQLSGRRGRANCDQRITILEVLNNWCEVYILVPCTPQGTSMYRREEKCVQDFGGET